MQIAMKFVLKRRNKTFLERYNRREDMYIDTRHVRFVTEGKKKDVLVFSTIFVAFCV